MIPWFQEPNEHQHFQRKRHPDTSEQDCRITEDKEEAQRSQLTYKEF